MLTPVIPNTVIDRHHEPDKKGLVSLKGCPRCKGTLHTYKDQWGWYVECLMCGHHEDPK